MKTAIIGLPMVGKTSLFTILTGAHHDTRIGSTAARTGVSKVPDARLEELARLFDPPKVTHATVEYVDMPSISKETLRDLGAMASLRVVDAFAHVLRLFADETIPHEKGSVDPVRDLEDVETELILSDLVVVEKRLERLDKDRKKIKNPEFDREFELLERCKSALENNQPLRLLEIDSDDEKRLRGFQSLASPLRLPQKLQRNSMLEAVLKVVIPHSVSSAEVEESVTLRASHVGRSEVG